MSVTRMDMVIRMTDKRRDALLASMEELDKVQAHGAFLFYGSIGTGKTVCAVQLAQRITPSNKNILYVDSHAGWVSLFNHDAALRLRVTRMVFKGVTQLEALVEAIVDPDDTRFNYGTVIIDEHSSVAQQHLDVVTMTAAKADSNHPGEDAPQWPDRNKSTNRLRKLTKLLMGAKINLILVSHERSAKVNDISVITADYPKATLADIVKPLHGVWRFTTTAVRGSEKGEVQRKIQIHNTNIVQCKSRVGGMPLYVSPGTLLDKVEEWLKTGADESEPAETVAVPVSQTDGIDIEEDE